MPKKQIDKHLLEHSTSLTQRVIQLGKLLWQGNKSRMGKALGLSHPVLSRVLREQQEPPGKLLEALARWPGVNVRWLFLGEGEPLSDRNLWAGGGRFLPIADRLLPGPPAQHLDQLTWTSLPVPEALFSPTAYWLRLQLSSSVVGEDTYMNIGDYILVETAASWTQRVEAVVGRLCAIRVPGHKGPQIIFGKIYTPEEKHLEPNFFPVTTYGGDRQVRFVKSMGASMKVPTGDEDFSFGLPNIVGVCIKLDRILS